MPLSPGDARWNALYLAKMKDMVGGRDSMRDALLTVKHSPESSLSDLSQLSAHQQVSLCVCVFVCVCIQSVCNDTLL